MSGAHRANSSSQKSGLETEKPHGPLSSFFDALSPETRPLLRTCLPAAFTGATAPDWLCPRE
jgi:hypothetical protein